MTQLLCSVGDDECKGKIHQHHDDYAKMDDTRPLCSYHHHRWHKQNGRAANWAEGPPVPLTVMVPRDMLEALRTIGARDERRASNLLLITAQFLVENPSLQDCVLTSFGFKEAA